MTTAARICIDSLRPVPVRPLVRALLTVTVAAWLDENPMLHPGGGRA